jgi:DNA-binding LytR/AlgR family response regulator
MISCIIIEDEPLAVANIKRSLSELGGITLSAVFDQPKSGFEYAIKHSIDLIFLDIHLGTENGLHHLKTAHEVPSIIVISANSHYALQGFDLNVCDYILKPFTQQRLQKAIEKYKASRANTYASSSHFIVKTETRLEKVFYRDLICIEGMGDYRRIITLHHKIMTLQTFREMEDVLDPHWVVRIHKSYMVQIRAIVEFQNTRVILSNGQQFPVSDTYRKAVKEKLVG